MKFTKKLQKWQKKISYRRVRSHICLLWELRDITNSWVLITLPTPLNIYLASSNQKILSGAFPWFLVIGCMRSDKKSDSHMRISFLIRDEQQAFQKSVIQAEAGHTALYWRLIYSLYKGLFHIVCVLLDLLVW